MTIESFFPQAPHDAPEQPMPPTTADLVAYIALLAQAVENADPGPAAPGGWEQRERLRISTWIRQVYDHPLSPRALAFPANSLIREVQLREAAELAFRIDVGRAQAKPAKPSADVRATAAVAASWAIAADALSRSPRPPRERVVGDAWKIVRAIIEPALGTAGTAFPRTHGAW